MVLTEDALKHTLTEIVDNLKSNYQPDEVILFGSYAYGQPQPHSDLDLFIIKDSPERPIERRLAVRRLLKKINFQIPLTLIVLTPTELDGRLEAGDQFLREIITRGKVLYARQRLHHPGRMVREG